MRPTIGALLAALAAVLASGSATALPARAQIPGCQFVLGFATLHALIPDTVGQCLADETHSPASGDGLQPTTNGLLVWRKSDNHTAFTDGFRTSENGPFGLQQRLNGQRFFWEQNPQGLPIVPPPVPGDRCHTAGLSLALVGTDAGAGNVVGTFSLTNNTGVSCTLFGFVGAQLLDAQNNALPTNVVRDGGFFTNVPGPTTVTLPAGGTAIFQIHWTQVPAGTETSCPTSSQLAVTPPDEFDTIIIPAQITACSGGRLDVTAIRPAG